MKKPLLAIVTVFLCGALTAQTSANLKLNLEKAKTYRFAFSTEQSTAQTVNGNRQNVDSKVYYTLSLKMIDVTPDFMVTEIHFDTLITRTNQMGKISNISSATGGNIKSSDVSEIMSYIMNGLCKNALYVKIDFSGKPLEVINAKMISDVVMKDTSSITVTGPTGAALKQQIAGAVSESSLKTMIEKFTAYVPGREVKKGETWNNIQKTNSGGMALIMNETSKLDEISGDKANISSETSIKPPENPTPIMSGGATVTYDNLQGISKSSLVVDIHTGLIREVKSKTSISGNLGVSAPGVSMQIPLEISGETTVKSIQ
jgi:hypothetical protein